MQEAVGSTLDALSRELDKRRLKTAKVGPRVSGKVVETVPAQGYGFIDIGVDEDVRFSRQVVLGDSFESIAAGDAVEVDIVETPQGYQVTRVVPL